MANYLTVDYFIGELAVGNLSGSNPAVTANVNVIKQYIALKEPVFMELLLGSDLYAEFLDGMAAQTPDAKWTELKDKIFKVDLLANTYISPAANYVFTFVFEKMMRSYGVGEKKTNDQAVADKLNSMDLIRAWQSMRTMVSDIWEWLEENLDTYPSFDPYQEDPFDWYNAMGI